MSPNTHQAPTRIAPTRDSIFVGNYTRSSQLVWITDLRDFRISLFNHKVVVWRRKIIIKRCSHLQASRRWVTHRRREGLKSNHFSNNLPDQNEDVLFNPRNPVNPDSKHNCKLPKPQTHRLQQQWNPIIRKIRDSDTLFTGIFNGTCRRKDDACIISTGWLKNRLVPDSVRFCWKQGLPRAPFSPLCFDIFPHNSFG